MDASQNSPKPQTITFRSECFTLCSKPHTRAAANSKERNYTLLNNLKVQQNPFVMLHNDKESEKKQEDNSEQSKWKPIKR